jgi:hypothetical protein
MSHLLDIKGWISCKLKQGSLGSSVSAKPAARDHPARRAAKSNRGVFYIQGGRRVSRELWPPKSKEMSRVYAFLALSAAALSSAYAFLPAPALSQISGRSTVLSGVSSLSMMRHRCKTPQLSLPADQRKALMRSLTTEVIRHGRITTTLARAKAIRGSVRVLSSLSCAWNQSCFIN